MAAARWSSQQSQARARIDWRKTDAGLRPFVIGLDGSEFEAGWAPQPGSQQRFLTCPVFEVLLEGPRGGGKTDVLLADFAQHVGQGFGPAWRGVLFRREYKQLADVIAKSKKLFHRVFPEARFLSSNDSLKWIFKDGEELLFRAFNKPDDYENYHGHEIPWIGWEELTLWPSLDGYRRMMTCCRSSHPGVKLASGDVLPIPRKIRATTNPYGVGHNLVKERFQLPQMRGRVIRNAINPETRKPDPERVAIFSQLSENKVLLAAEPDYLAKIAAGARNASERAAWIDGSWDITAGGMLDDLFDSTKHIVPTFKIPATWRIDRSFDWGSSKPFSVIWWAESDGSPITLDTGRTMPTIKGDLFAVAEWYGCVSGSPNEGLKFTGSQIAAGIKEREPKLFAGRIVLPGPADASIFDVENGVSIAEDMKRLGVRWLKSFKGPGSRKNGWEALRNRLRAAIAQPGMPRESAGLFVCDNCREWIRTVPTLPRDDRDPDDVDTECEDHAGDSTRYRIHTQRSEFVATPIAGR